MGDVDVDVGEITVMNGRSHGGVEDETEEAGNVVMGRREV